jgi:RNase H-like domain found in reverse transcriptase
VPGFASLMQPVVKLLRNKDKNSIEWGLEQQEAVQKVVEKLKTDCFLALPDFDKPFYVTTDYSGIGIGAALL